MRKVSIASLIFLSKSIVLLTGLLLTLQLKNPAFADFRTLVFWSILTIEVSLLLIEIVRFRKSQLQRSRKVWTLSFCVVTLVILLSQAAQFQVLKYQVLQQNSEQLARLGQHFIVGYRNFDEVKNLVGKRAIAGIFITHRNVINKDTDQIRQDIQTLQSIRKSQGLPPLWIATDQEGGIVSSLSPPLSQLPPLSQILQAKILQDKTKPEAQKMAIEQYAERQAKELANIGVNLNFAPVVDLNQGVVVEGDRFSLIHKRAISSEPATVTKVATWYCDTLAIYNVHCTMKHFPGLGRVNADTHTTSAHLDTAIDDLKKSDWLPFRALMQNTSAFTMIGHVILTAIDPLHPASFSRKIVTDLIRKEWQYDGLLITDDFGMQAIYRSKSGLENAVVQAIDAGVDIVLLSFDQDLYYPAMQALMKAEQSGTLDRDALRLSQQRIINALQK